MQNYILSSALFIVIGGIIGWAIAFFSGADTTTQSTYTGYGCAVGVAVAGIYYATTRPRK